MRIVLAYSGTSLEIVATSIYIRSTFRGHVKPNRVSYILWSLAPLVGFSIQIAGGFKPSALMTLVVGVGPLAIFIASFHDPDSYWQLKRFDFVCGLLSVCALMTWRTLGSRALGISFAALSDAIAYVPTLRKVWIEPTSEQPWIWWLGCVSGVLVLISIAPWSFVGAIFPLSLAVMNGSVATVCYWRDQEAENG